MFRNPRENANLSPDSTPVKPSAGRPPSPPSSSPAGNTSSSKKPSLLHQATLMPNATNVSTKTGNSRPQKSPLSTKSTNSSIQNGRPMSTKKTFGAKTPIKANGSILNFFKKTEADNGLFLREKIGARSNVTSNTESDTELYMDEATKGLQEGGDGVARYNEFTGSIKRRKTDEAGDSATELDGTACTPPPPEPNPGSEDENIKADPDQVVASKDIKAAGRSGPFVDDSDSEDEKPAIACKPIVVNSNPPKTIEGNFLELSHQPSTHEQGSEESVQGEVPPLLKQEETSYVDMDGFDDFEGMGDFEDEEFPEEGEEFFERRLMEEQERLELEGEDLVENDAGGLGGDSEFESEAGESRGMQPSIGACPICGVSFEGVSDQEASVHVNHCLDGNPTPLPELKPQQMDSKEIKVEENGLASRFKRPARPAKPGQQNPFTLGEPGGLRSSAFSKLMSGHAEDAAWATAAAAEHAARGKPAYQRTCPFYKILPGFSICVDAFRYGAVEGCQAYFLSHFHSDHYIGLTSHWCHGPIYCSRVTGNLVRQQLRVDPKWVVDLEFEEKREVPGTNGVEVTMIPANHCPGSSLYLFEKTIGRGKNPKVQRVLHCGDFRACRAHIEHPLLRPEIIDPVSGKSRHQKIDVCYLDTTYLNPKYAFPSQYDVIQACADMCVSLNKVRVDGEDGWEQMKRDRAGSGMAKFVRKESDPATKQEDDNENGREAVGVDAMAVSGKSSTTKARGRLLVVVGTYSIGKERICLGIAKALNSKIYAPPPKQRICACLEDPELSARLTTDPRAAQVHMTPLFEIRAETLDDYLKDYKDHFSRAVGFRPSGWNYRPPNSRFTESPSVSTVLNSENWRSGYSMRELVPQRGSTSRASCFGVPYSEHSSFRELTMFCCALRIEKIIPTVNVGSAKGRGRMKEWCERWAVEKRKNGLWKVEEVGW
ncbi:MAG: hypothetical protein M1822_000104 [Bathelium mastoideum]|nr:MAG: hypothetical protein M1822_000104 [Bathelium mastoideum]